MASSETQLLDEVIAGSRRRLLAMGGAALAGLILPAAAEAQTATLTDSDYLNFALNLEYLEANYYTLAATGKTIDQAGVSLTGPGIQGAVTTKPGGPASCAVPFANAFVKAYAAEIAQEERNHVNFLRTALGSAAVAQPAIDLYNSFNSLAPLLKIKGLTSFDPFADDASFLLGAYTFEVGVSAYTGAAPLLTSTTFLDAAAGIQGVEAYHYGLVRTTIVGLDQTTNPLGALGTVPAGTLASVASAISVQRAKWDGTSTDANPSGSDRGLGGQTVALNATTLTSTTGNPTTLITATSIVNATTTDTVNGGGIPSSGTSGSMVVPRTPAQVLSIVYAGGKTSGGFFPAGLNGSIK